MRKLSFFLLAAAVLAAAGALAGSATSAPTASATVTVTRTGYKPTSVSIIAGETVAFGNGDTVAHTVAFKSTTGMHCTIALPLALQPAQTASCTFSTPGKFNFTDPVNKGKNFRGTVTVGQPLTASFAAAPKTVVYGRKTTLTGALVSQQAGQSLDVLAQVCGASTPTKVATVTTTTGGAFSYPALPLKATTYTVKSKNLTSSGAAVKVLPRLHLRKIARHRYLLTVSAAESFAGKYATFQRYRAATKRWRRVKRVLLRANTAGVAPTVISSAKFRSSIRSRVRVRVIVGQKQVGSCYLAGRSNTIRS
jgi:plastocyanin